MPSSTCASDGASALAEGTGDPSAAAGLPPLREVIRRHGLRADKRFGQHFLVDPSILRTIAARAGDLADRHVMEVGPGPGGLTRALLARGAARVTVVEKDERFLPALRELAAAHPDRLHILAEDARRVRPRDLAGDGSIKIVANLPYNVGSELLIDWLHEVQAISDMTLMFQREVALRLTARPGTGDWGRLGVLAQRVCRIETLLDLPAAAFVPPPRVRSTLVRLVPRDDAPDARYLRRLKIVTASAFGQRRKMLRTSLKAWRPDAERWLQEIGVDASRRAESLQLAEIDALVRLDLARLSEERVDGTA